VALGKVRVLHVPTSAQFADIFTKGLPTASFIDIRSSLNVIDPDVATAGGIRDILYSCTPSFVHYINQPLEPRSIQSIIQLLLPTPPLTLGRRSRRQKKPGRSFIDAISIDTEARKIQPKL
jgi:hypothetical protein